MTTPLSFTVVVTGCKNCYKRVSGRCYHEDNALKGNSYCDKLYNENKDQLTNSCPMVAKEGEKR